jgi:hypothetical protein
VDELRRPTSCAVVMTSIQSDRVRGLHDFEPLAGFDLVRADHGADLVVEDLGRSAGQGAQTGRLQFG